MVNQLSGYDVKGVYDGNIDARRNFCQCAGAWGLAIPSVIAGIGAGITLGVLASKFKWTKAYAILGMGSAAGGGIFGLIVSIPVGYAAGTAISPLCSRGLKKERDQLSHSNAMSTLIQRPGLVFQEWCDYYEDGSPAACVSKMTYRQLARLDMGIKGSKAHEARESLHAYMSSKNELTSMNASWSLARRIAETDSVDSLKSILREQQSAIRAMEVRTPGLVMHIAWATREKLNELKVEDQDREHVVELLLQLSAYQPLKEASLQHSINQSVIASDQSDRLIEELSPEELVSLLKKLSENEEEEVSELKELAENTLRQMVDQWEIGPEGLEGLELSNELSKSCVQQIVNRYTYVGDAMEWLKSHPRWKEPVLSELERRISRQLTRSNVVSWMKTVQQYPDLSSRKTLQKAIENKLIAGLEIGDRDAWGSTDYITRRDEKRWDDYWGVLTAQVPSEFSKFKRKRREHLQATKYILWWTPKSDRVTDKRNLFLWIEALKQKELPELVAVVEERLAGYLSKGHYPKEDFKKAWEYASENKHEKLKKACEVYVRRHFTVVTLSLHFESNAPERLTKASDATR